MDWALGCVSFAFTPMIVIGIRRRAAACAESRLLQGVAVSGVWRRSGTRKIDVLGGPLKHTLDGVDFSGGGGGHCGLPPLNGFVSELLVYLGAWRGVRSARSTHSAVLISRRVWR